MSAPLCSTPTVSERHSRTNPRRRLTSTLWPVALAVSVAILFSFCSAPDRGPSYHAKPADYWLEHSEHTIDDFKESIQAFQALGSNAVPFLLRCLERRPSRLGEIFDDKIAPTIWKFSLTHEIPFGLAEARFPSAERVRNRREMAAFLLGEIGPEAQEAIPTLLRIYSDDNDDWPKGKYELWGALSHMKGAPILAHYIPQFIEQLKSDDFSTRVDGADFLELVGPPAKSAVPLLLTLAQNSSSNSFSFARALWSIDRRTNAVLPVFIAGVQSTNDGRRELALTYLGEMGPAATAAREAIAKLLNDPEYRLRFMATNLLSQLR
jgi:hypothetical protein